MDLTKYTIYHSISVFILAYAVYFHNAFNVLLVIDPTRVTLIILAIYICLSLYMGIKQNKTNFKLVKHIGNRLTSIGLAGTVIGIMMLMASIGHLDLTNINSVVGPLFSGMATVFITTLFGIIGYLLVDFQIAFCFGRYDE